MSEENRYVRTALAATKKGVPDPAFLVDTWLDQLEDLRDAPTWQHGAPSGEDFFDLISLRGRLQRVRPELIGQLDGADALAWAESQVGRLAPPMLEQALRVFDGDAWLTKAAKLSESYEDWIESAERSSWAEVVLTDLDDADLVLCAAEEMGGVNEEVADKLAECSAWAVDHADVFLSAGVWVQAVGETMRPDLAEFHAGSALTAEKYVSLLDELEVAEGEMSYADVRPMDSEVAKELWRRASEEVRLQQPPEPPDVTPLPPQTPAWLPPLWTPQMAAAARAARPRFLDALKWRSPDGSMEARLVLPELPQRGEEEPVRVTFHRLARGDRAVGLAGTPVNLASVPSVIAEDGSAVFVLGRLRAAGQEPVLRVGPEHRRWALLSPGSAEP